MNEVLFALVMVFSPSVDSWEERVALEAVPFEVCDAAQKAVWSQEWEIVGVDGEGFEIPKVDAYCVQI